MLTISASITNKEFVEPILKLANRLNLPINQPANAYLIYADHGLSILKEKTHINVDFLDAALLIRAKKATTKNEAIAKAMALKKTSPIQIMDATAGFGADAFILAVLGFHITLLERNPIMHALLEDALARLAQNKQWGMIASRLTLFHADALDFLKTCHTDIVYLDPMFPPKNKRALSNKRMMFLQQLIGASTDFNELLTTALACARKRVVVKRPRLANDLIQKKPSYTLIGRSNRFDIYLSSEPHHDNVTNPV